MLTTKTVTFETKCYENDWEYTLIGDRLKNNILHCKFPFQSRKVFINNVKDPEKVMDYAQKKVVEGIIDEYVLVSDYADEALKFFNIDKESFKGGYVYSISEIVSLYLCKTDYLLHFSSDSRIWKKDGKWVEEAIKLMEDDSSIIVANPCWNGRIWEAMMESEKRRGTWFIGKGFSDQCYLVPMRVFKNQIYNEKNPASERYPKYGGELFEKRIDSYMRNHNLSRATSIKAWYRHKNFPRK